MYVSYMHFGQITSVILVYCKTINLPARVLFLFACSGGVKINDGVDLSPVMTMQWRL